MSGKTKTNVKKEGRTGLNVIADLLEGGKLADLDENDKALLLALVGGQAPAPAKPEEPPPVEMSAPVAEAFKRAKEQTDSLAKKNADLEDEVRKLKAQAQHGELVEVVKRDYAHLPTPEMDVHKAADLLGRVRSELAKADADAIEAIFKASSQLISKGALSSQGYSDPGHSDTSAYSIIKRAAEAIKREKGDKISLAEAMREAGRRNPEAWAEYRSNNTPRRTD